MSSPTPSPGAEARAVSPRARAAAISPFITIEPDYLTFPPPHYGRCIQNVVYLYNTATVPCVYKLRSQNPDRYIAKPHVAVVAPKSATRVRVTLRNMGDSPKDNISPTEQDRFRVSVKILNTPARQKLIEAQNYDPKKVWEAAGPTIEHEKDLMAFFKPGVEAPPNGMVTFLPPHYLPVPARGSSTTRRDRSRMGSVPSAETPRRNLAGDMEQEATPSTAGSRPAPEADAAKSTPGSPVAANGQVKVKKGGDRRWRKFAAFFVVLSLLVLVAACVVGSQDRIARGVDDDLYSARGAGAAANDGVDDGAHSTY